MAKWHLLVCYKIPLICLQFVLMILLRTKLRHRTTHLSACIVLSFYSYK